MRASTLDVEGLLYFEPTRFEDSRGFLYERYNSSTLEALSIKFVQQNVSVSKQGVIRGMHWQYPPYAQGKLVTCLHGEIFDVAVDIRSSSPTFGKYVGTKLSGSRGDSLWIPRGFAHGFQALTDEAVVTYSVDVMFVPAHASGFNPLDENLQIQWPLSFPTLSVKDRDAKPLTAINSSKLFS